MFDCKKFLKDFMKGDKEDRMDILNDRLDGFVEYFLGDFKNNPLKDEVYDLILSKKFAKALKRYIKEYTAPMELVLVIADSFGKIKNNSEESENNKELVTIYVSILNELLEKRVKKVVKATGLPETVAQNILIECPEEICDKKPQQQFMYIRRVIRKLYVIDTVYKVEENSIEVSERILKTEILLKLFKTVFGDDLLDKVCSVILLENRKNANLCSNMSEESKLMWNAITDVALLTLNYSGKKKEIAVWLDRYYVKRRMRDKDLENNVNRRINLTEIDEEKYPKVVKAVNYLIEENDSVEKYLN